MPANNKKLTAAMEAYFRDLRSIRASGGGTHERSYYPPLVNLLNAVGSSLRPRVFCVSEMAGQGAGHPDIGLFGAKQLQKGKLKQGQTPEAGVVEVKPARDDAWLTAGSDQVSGYWGLYRLVLVTNTRDFVLLGEDGQGNPAKLETFRLAGSAADFESKLQHPRAFAHAAGPALSEYLGRALSHRATLSEPRDLAWLLASYARDGPGPGRGGGRRAVTQCRAIGAGGSFGREVRGRAGRSLLPLDPGADTLLRRLLRLGAVGPADSASVGNLQLA